MDEMQLLREFAGTDKLDSPAELASAKDRLTAAFETPVAPVTPIRRRRRALWTGVTVVGLAAAITGVLALAPADQLGVGTPSVQADPVVVLRQAAAEALKEPVVAPRPDQFIYTKTESAYGVREAWLSADGTRDGLVRQYGEGDSPLPGCTDGQRKMYKGPDLMPGTEPCEPIPAFDPGLPTDGPAMLDYLRGVPTGEPDEVHRLGKESVGLLRENYLTSASRAAVFEAIALTPGLKVISDVRDAAGRPGIGVTWVQEGDVSRNVFVFDATTFGFLGTTGGEAVVERAVVDQPGQLPIR